MASTGSDRSTSSQPPVKAQRRLRELLGPDDAVIYSTRQHVVIVLDDLLRMAALLVLLGAAAWVIDEAGFLDAQWREWLTWAGWAIVALIIVRALWTLLVWHREQLIVTSSKVLHVRGVLNIDATGTPLSKIDELTVRQPFLGRVFNYGRLDIENAGGGQEPLHGLRYVPSPRTVYRVVTEQARRQRLEEGGARVDDRSYDPAEQRAELGGEPTGGAGVTGGSPSEPTPPAQPEDGDSTTPS